jgi:hypothetical protein
MRPVDSLPIRSLGRAMAVAAALTLAARPAAAQAPPATDTSSPPAAPADVRSLDAIMHAVYDVVSGPAGGRNWPRLYSLFIPGGRFVPTYRDTAGAIHVETMTPQGYVRLYGDYFLHHGFYEREIGREVTAFGPMTHVFSTYESRHASNDPKPFVRGINSFQLFYDGTRWYVVNVYWAEEGPHDSIPSRYLGENK